MGRTGKRGDKHLPPLAGKDLARFLSKFVQGDPDACWEWTLAPDKRGYGQFKYQGIMCRAHRVSIFHFSGIDPGQLNTCHSCDNRMCVNWNHLFNGSYQDNADDMKRKGRAATGVNNAAHLYPERRPRGERQGAAKLTEADIKEIRRLVGCGAGRNTVAKRFRITKANVGYIVRRDQWKHVA